MCHLHGCLFVCAHRLLICLLSTACFTRTLCCTHLFIHLLAHAWACGKRVFVHNMNASILYRFNPQWGSELDGKNNVNPRPKQLKRGRGSVCERENEMKVQCWWMKQSIIYGKLKDRHTFTNQNTTRNESYDNHARDRVTVNVIYTHAHNSWK